MKSLQFAAQPFEAVAWRHEQVLIGRRVVKYLQFAEKSARQIRRDITRVKVIHEERAQPMRVSWPGIGEDEILASIELLGRKVLPEVRRRTAAAAP